MTVYSALVTAEKRALLVLSKNPATITFLAQNFDDTERLYYCNNPNYLKDFPLARADPATYPEYVFNLGTRLFVAKENVDDKLRALSALAVCKANVLQTLTFRFNILRFPVWRDLLMQDTVNAIRSRQAREFKQALERDESAALAFPFVKAYADHSQMSMEQAADEILFKAKLDEDFLCKSETLRLRYFNWLREAKDITEVNAILRKLSEDVL